MAEQEQYRNPRGDEGKAVVEKMIEHHKELLSWAQSNLDAVRPKRALDIGCGGGACVRTLLMRYPSCHVDGVDISKDALAVAEKHLGMMLRMKRATLTEASVDNLPFEDGTFQVVTAIETYFFWPDLDKALSECVRVMSPGATLMIASEQYPDGENDKELAEACKEYHMSVISNDDMLAKLQGVGLSAEAITEPDRGWVVFIAKKD